VAPAKTRRQRLRRCDGSEVLDVVTNEQAEARARARGARRSSKRRVATCLEMHAATNRMRRGIGFSFARELAWQETKNASINVTRVWARFHGSPIVGVGVVRSVRVYGLAPLLGRYSPLDPSELKEQELTLVVG
jgi:hypothetical protein